MSRRKKYKRIVDLITERVNHPESEMPDCIGCWKVKSDPSDNRRWLWQLLKKYMTKEEVVILKNELTKVWRDRSPRDRNKVYPLVAMNFEKNNIFSNPLVCGVSVEDFIDTLERVVESLESEQYADFK